MNRSLLIIYIYQNIFEHPFPPNASAGSPDPFWWASAGGSGTSDGPDNLFSGIHHHYRFTKSHKTLEEKEKQTISK